MGTMVSKEVGYDGGKKVRGRKCHLLIDTLGLQVNLERLIVIYVDGGCKGENLFAWVIAYVSRLFSNRCCVPKGVVDLFSYQSAGSWSAPLAG
jgi:hypothetical protein